MKIYWCQLLFWAFKAWPVLALVPVAITHYLAFKSYPIELTLINKITGMSLQMVGGLLVLYAINDNLGIFRKQSLLSTILSWVRGFPFEREPLVVHGNAAGAASFTSTASIRAGRATSSIEERIAELEIQVSEIRHEVQNAVRAAAAQLESARIELQGQISNTSSKVSDLSQKMEHAAVGWFKVQTLGVLLALYGAVTSVFA